MSAAEIPRTRRRQLASTANPLLDAPDEQWLQFLDELDEQSLQLKDEDWEKLKDENWVRLTDEEVEELMNLDVPQRWGQDHTLIKKYHHATLFQRFGDIPQVRFIVEFERMGRSGVVTLELAKQIAAHAEAMYFLSPNAATQRSLQETRNLLRNIEKQGGLRALDQLRIADPEAWVKGMRAALIERHGDSQKLKRLSILCENWNWIYREQTKNATLILRHTKFSTGVPVIPCLTYSMLCLRQ